MSEIASTRESLIETINFYCEQLEITPPGGFPDAITDDEMEQWIESWDEYDPLAALEGALEPNCFIFSDYEFPICNHIKGLTDDNIGYTSGIFIDGTPFEAEIYEYNTPEGKNVDVGVIIPVIRDRKAKNSKTNSNVSGIKYTLDVMSNGILNLGMVDEGYEEDDETVDSYVQYLVDNEVFDFTSNLWNGSVMYCTDMRGSNLAYITVSIKLNDETQAYTNLKFRDFPIRKGKKNTLKVVK